MIRNGLLSPILYVGLIAGFLGARYFMAAAPVPEKNEMPETAAVCKTPDFSWLNENKIRRYYELSAITTRYQWADQSFGKLGIALLNAEVLTVSPDLAENLKQSAEGNAAPFPPAACAPALPVPAQAPVIAAAPPPPPKKPKPAHWKSIDDQVDGKEPAESVSFPFSKMASYKTTMCEGEGEWFVTNGFKTYFAAEPDPADEKSSELVGTIASTSLQRSELTLLHCLPPLYKNWRVNITAMVKAENVRNAKFIARRWNASGMEFKMPNHYPIGGTFDWKEVEFSVVVPSASFAFGVEMIGSGKIYLKDVKVIRWEKM